MDQAQGYIGQQLGGQNAYQGGANPYAGANPYLGQMIGSAQDEVTQQYTDATMPNMLAQFNAGGAYGGSAMQQSMSGAQQNLGRELGGISMQMRNADYNRQAQLAESGLDRSQSAWAQNQNNNLQAMGQIPGLNSSKYDDARALMNIGQQEQNLRQSVYDTGYENFTEERDWDKNQLGVLANALGTVQGGSSSQTGANPNYKSAGQNAAGYAALLASMWG